VSLQLWRQFLPNTKVSFLESNKACAEKFRAAIERDSGGILYAGNQADTAFLQDVVTDAEETGLYDIIIDDGGHNPTVQLISLFSLWASLKSGGVYVVEDVHPTYFSHDVQSGIYKATGPTFMEWVAKLVHLVHCNSGMRGVFNKNYSDACNNATAIEKSVLSVECMIEACVLVKR
jgi:hypothetical protein